MSDWQPIQLLPIVAPLWDQPIHQADEPGVVRAFQEVSHLMDHYVSRHSGGFLARSVFRQMLRLEAVQLPHFVFIWGTKTRST